MPLNDGAANRQTHARAALIRIVFAPRFFICLAFFCIVGGIMQALKDGENRFGLFGREAASVVGDFDFAVFTIEAPAHAHDGRDMPGRR